MSVLYPTDLMSYLGISTIFLRLLGLFLVAPFFSHRAIMGGVRILLALALALALFPMLKEKLPAIPTTLSGLIGLALQETIIGFLMGFVAQMTFEGVQLAAQFVGYQLGFGTAGLLDPTSQSQVSIWVPLQGWLILMVFLSLDLHHLLLNLVVKSYETTPSVSGFASVEASYPIILKSTGRIFWIAVQMAAPFTFMIMCVNGVLGVLSRTLPQMNLLLFAFPITITLGLVTLYLISPEILQYCESILSEMVTDVVSLLKVW